MTKDMPSQTMVFQLDLASSNSFDRIHFGDWYTLVVTLVIKCLHFDINMFVSIVPRQSTLEIKDFPLQQFKVIRKDTWQDDSDC